MIDAETALRANVAGGPRGHDARDVFELLPVIEIASYGYARSDAETDVPADPARGHSTSFHRDEHDERCMRAAGFGALMPIAPRGRHFRVATLVEPAMLSKLAARALESCATMPGTPDEIEQYLSALDGGIVIRQHGTLALELGCCADLAGIAEWCDLVVDRCSDERNVWIGHDASTLTARFEPARGEFAFRIGSWSGADVSEIAVSPDLLEDAVRDAVRALEDFAARLAPCMPDAIPIALRTAIARKLAGLARLREGPLECTVNARDR
ncbi:MAG: hypothetical protein M3Y87_07230 [Myxococcota bacterium]|nr:hypothetical protein [Myxococcota bacterium]